MDNLGKAVRREIVAILDEVETLGYEDVEDFVTTLREVCAVEEVVQNDDTRVAVPIAETETTQPERAPRQPRLAVDRTADLLDAEAIAPALIAQGKRLAVGMSPALATVMAKKEQGMDLTPIQFELPPPQSYFKRRPTDLKWENGERVPNPFDGQAFETRFIDRVKAGENEAAAYVATCTEFGVPTMPKGGSVERVLAELPEEAGGGFGLSRDDARRKLKKAGLLGRMGQRLLGEKSKDENEEEGE